MANTISHDKLDQLSYNRSIEDSTVLREAVDGQVERLNTVPELAEDIFYSLSKYRPKMVDEVPPAYQLNKQLVESVMASSQYDKARASTMGDEFRSAMATTAFMESILGNVPKEQLDEANGQIQALMHHGAELDSLAAQVRALQSMLESDPPHAPQLRKDLKKTQAAHEAAQETFQGFQKALDGQLDDMALPLRRAAAQALEKATQTVNDFSTAAAGWGMGQGEFSSTTFEEKMELFNHLKNNPNLQEISQMLGRLKRLASKKRAERSKRSTRRLVGVETGANLSRVLPSQTVLLGDPTLELLFAKKYSERQLMQYKTGGKEKQGRGPIVVCVDESGSMSGLRLTWSKAITLALAEVAKKENRAFKVFSFSDEVKEWDSVATPAEAVDYAKHFIGGGTNFERPLLKARVFIQQNAEFHKGDIVFITDGEASVRSGELYEIAGAKKKIGLQVHGISVGRSANPRSLQAFCDQVHNLHDITREVKEHSTTEKILDAVLS